MSMFDRIEEHRDLVAGLEYEEHHENLVSSGLCERCKNDAALPDDPDGWCRSCAAEVEAWLAEVEAA